MSILPARDAKNICRPHNFRKEGMPVDHKKILVAGSIVLDIVPEVYIPKEEPVPNVF